MVTLSSYEQLLTAPEPLNSFGEYAQASGELFLLCLLLAWPLALVMKMVLSREKLGTSNRIRFAMIWTAIVLGGASLINVAVLLFIGKVPDWSAVSPHATVAFVMGIIALVGFFGGRAELKTYRGYVENARQQAA